MEYVKLFVRLLIGNEFVRLDANLHNFYMYCSMNCAIAKCAASQHIMYRILSILDHGRCVIWTIEAAENMLITN